MVLIPSFFMQNSFQNYFFDTYNKLIPYYHEKEN